MANQQFTAQTAALNTSDAASVKVVSDAINASALSADDKAAAQAALAARVNVINGR